MNQDADERCRNTTRLFARVGIKGDPWRREKNPFRRIFGNISAIHGVDEPPTWVEALGAIISFCIKTAWIGVIAYVVYKLFIH